MEERRTVRILDLDLAMAEGGCSDHNCTLSTARAGLEEMQNLRSGIEESLSSLAQVQTKVMSALAALDRRCIATSSDAFQQGHREGSVPSDSSLNIDELKEEQDVTSSLQITSRCTVQHSELHQEYQFRHEDWDRVRFSAISPEASVSLQALSKRVSHEKRLHSITMGERIEPARHSYIMDPHSRPRRIVDAMSMLIIGFDMFVIPVLLAWNIEFTGWIFYAAIGSLLHWTFDIFATFRTAIYVKGVLEHSPRVIAKQYLRTWFAPDLLVVIADYLSTISMVFMSSTRAPELKMMRVFKVGRALRMLKVIKMRAFMETMDKLAEWYLPIGMEVVTSIVKIVVLLLWMNHIVACAWYALGSQLLASHTDTGLRWADMAVAPGSEHNYHALSIYAYFSALHWALCQMTPGSMQVNPVNSVERWFTILCLIVGMVFFSSLVSSASAKLTEIRLLKEKATSMKNSLQQFLMQINIGKAVSLAAQKELAERLSCRVPLMPKDVKALPLLSHQLQVEISSAMFLPHLKRKALFSWWGEAEPSLLSDFCHNALESLLLRSGDSLFHTGENARHAYIVVAGQLQYTWHRSELDLAPYVSEAKTGNWLSEVALWCKWKHVGTMLASTQCELIAISVQGLLQHLTKSTELLALNTFADYAICFRASYEQNAYQHFVTNTFSVDSMPESADASPVWLLNDVVESSLKEILPSMKADSRELIGSVALKCLKHNRSRRLMPLPAAFNQLSKEVSSGKCLLMLDGSGEVERIKPVIALRIVADDGMIFARLGTWDPTARKVSPSCFLPGTKQRPGEKTSDALHRALTQDLAILAGVIRLQEGYEFQTESKVSRSTGIRTEYRLTVCEASLCHFWSELPLVEPQRVTAQASLTQNSRHLIRDVCLLNDPNGTTVVFHGWMSPHFFEQCKSNERLLLPHLSPLTVSQWNMDQLARCSCAVTRDTVSCSLDAGSLSDLEL